MEKWGPGSPEKSVAPSQLRPPPCLQIKIEEMINSEKRQLFHDYYQSHILFLWKVKSFLLIINQ